MSDILMPKDHALGVLRAQPTSDDRGDVRVLFVGAVGDEEVGQGDDGVVMAIVGEGHWTLDVVALEGDSLDEVGAASGIDLKSWDAGLDLFGESRVDRVGEVLTIIDTDIEGDTILLEDVFDGSDIGARVDVHGWVAVGGPDSHPF